MKGFQFLQLEQLTEFRECSECQRFACGPVWVCRGCAKAHAICTFHFVARLHDLGSKELRKGHHWLIEGWQNVGGNCFLARDEPKNKPCFWALSMDARNAAAALQIGVSSSEWSEWIATAEMDPFAHYEGLRSFQTLVGSPIFGVPPHGLCGETIFAYAVSSGALDIVRHILHIPKWKQEFKSGATVWIHPIPESPSMNGTFDGTNHLFESPNVSYFELALVWQRWELALFLAWMTGPEALEKALTYDEVKRLDDCRKNASDACVALLLVARRCVESSNRGALPAYLRDFYRRTRYNGILVLKWTG